MANENSERYLTFALGKGRLANQTLKLFEQIGITCEEMKDKETRKLIFVNEELKLRFFLAKGPDVPTYVEYESPCFLIYIRARETLSLIARCGRGAARTGHGRPARA